MPSLVEIGPVILENKISKVRQCILAIPLISPLGFLHSNKYESPPPKDALCQVWLKLAQWFLRRRFLKFVNVFSLFPYYLNLEKGVALHLNKIEFPSPNYALCQVWLKLAQWFLRRRFLKFVNVFLLFPYYLPLEKGGILHLKKLNPHHPQNLQQPIIPINLPSFANSCWKKKTSVIIIKWAA